VCYAETLLPLRSYCCCCRRYIWQVLALAAELEEALLQLSVRDQVLDQVWSQLKGLPQYTEGPGAAAATAPGSPGRADSAAATGSLSADSSWQQLLQQPSFKSAALERLQQQQSRQQQQQQYSARRLSSQRSGLLSSGSGAVAALAQQALQAARRRSSQHSARPSCDYQGATPAVDRSQGPAGVRAAAATTTSALGSIHASRRLSGYNTCAPGTPPAARQGSFRSRKGTGESGISAASQQSQKVQPLVVAAVRQLRNQVESLQQQLAEADAGSRDSDANATRLRQRLAELREQHEQLVDSNEQLQHEKKQLTTRCRQLSLQLQETEQELEQAQVLGLFSVFKW
jgi:hypothetical protein